MNEAKREADYRWGRGFSREYEQNKKFSKEVKRVGRGSPRNEETVKDINGQSVKRNEAL